MLLAVSIAWGSSKKGCMAPVTEVWNSYKAGVELILTRAIWLFL